MAVFFGQRRFNKPCAQQFFNSTNIEVLPTATADIVNPTGTGAFDVVTDFEQITEVFFAPPTF